MCDVSVTSIIVCILCNINGKDYRRTSSINLLLNGDNVYRQCTRTRDCLGCKSGALQMLSYIHTHIQLSQNNGDHIEHLFK